MTGQRLTKHERAAIRSALARFIADDHNEEDFDGFDPNDVESALGKMQDTTPPLKCLHRCRRIVIDNEHRWRCILCGNVMKLLNGVNQDALDTRRI
jgi:hypothetical protein